MKLTEILTERISDIVYRLVPFTTALRNLENNEFQLTPMFVDSGMGDYKFQRGKLYYLSLARTVTSGFFKHAIQNHTVIYVLDGRKLSHNYKGIPVNYYSDREFYPDSSKDREAEDRIISDSPVIPNASKYIKEIHILIMDNAYGKSIKKLEGLAKRHNISIYFYITNSSDDDFRKIIKGFSLLKKNMAVNTYNVNNSEEVPQNSPGMWNESADGAWIYQLLMLYKNPEYKKVARKIKDSFEEAKTDPNYALPNFQYIVREIQFQLSGTYRRNRFALDALKEVHKIMRKHHLKKIEDFIRLVSEKYNEAN